MFGSFSLRLPKRKALHLDFSIRHPVARWDDRFLFFSGSPYARGHFFADSVVVGTVVDDVGVGVVVGDVVCDVGFNEVAGAL